MSGMAATDMNYRDDQAFEGILERKREALLTLLKLIFLNRYTDGMIRGTDMVCVGP